MAAAATSSEADTIHAVYSAALAEGRLLLQRCVCGTRFVPARTFCPACLGADWRWQDAHGGGRLESWVIYHVALHPAFRDRLPYNVALVELDEGVRLITTIVGDDALLRGDARVRFLATKQDGAALARFELVP